MIVLDGIKDDTRWLRGKAGSYEESERLYLLNESFTGFRLNMYIVIRIY